MKKLIPLIPVLVAMFSIISCNQAKSTASCGDSCSDHNSIDTLSVCGVVFDGAMNSIFIVTPKGDSLSFGYPELDPARRVKWAIGDTITINYVTIKVADDMAIDSVISMTKGCVK